MSEVEQRPEWRERKPRGPARARGGKLLDPPAPDQMVHKLVSSLYTTAMQDADGRNRVLAAKVLLDVYLDPEIILAEILGGRDKLLDWMRATLPKLETQQKLLQEAKDK